MLQKQIQKKLTNLFKKLPVPREVVAELLSVIKVSSYYRKDQNVAESVIFKLPVSVVFPTKLFDPLVYKLPVTVCVPIKVLDPVVAMMAIPVVLRTSTCTDEDTVPTGKSMVTCADDDTVPAGAPPFNAYDAVNA